MNKLLLGIAIVTTLASFKTTNQKLNKMEEQDAEGHHPHHDRPQYP